MSTFFCLSYLVNESLCAFFLFFFFIIIERLSQKDAVVIQALSEKLQLFAEMAESVGGLEDTASRSRLLLRGDASDLHQGETLLKGAITEGRTVHMKGYLL